MPAAKPAAKTAAKPSPQTAAKRATTTAAKPAARRREKTASSRMTFSEVMGELERAGTAQARKIYARHGASDPMFGVSFATLKALMKRIGVDHDLALALWGTGNVDARNLAVKIVDPARMSPADLDRWAREACTGGVWVGYPAMLPVETAHGPAKVRQWLASKDAKLRASGWTLLSQLALRDESLPDAEFEDRLAEIERTIGTASNAERYVMNSALIAIGCRSASLKKATLAAAKRIGKVEVDHGDTSCKTPDAREYVEKSWAHSTSKGFESPAAHERSRDTPRLRC